MFNKSWVILFNLIAPGIRGKQRIAQHSDQRKSLGGGKTRRVNQKTPFTLIRCTRTTSIQCWKSHRYMTVTCKPRVNHVCNCVCVTCEIFSGIIYISSLRRLEDTEIYTQILTAQTKNVSRGNACCFVLHLKLWKFTYFD